MQAQLSGGIQYGFYKTPANASVCKTTSAEPRTNYTVKDCMLTEADYREFLHLIVKDRFQREFGRATRHTQQQYLTALDKELLFRMPKSLRATPCTKITAFLPEVNKSLVQQGNYEFMPEFARQPSPTKSKPYWQVVKKLGKGSVGMVYVVVNSTGQNFALKVQIVTPGQRRFMSVEDEVKLQMFFANLNLAPRIIGITSVQLLDPKRTQVQIILMEPVDFTLDDLLCHPNTFDNKWVPVIAEQLKHLFLALHKYGITHGDLHSGNIGFVYKRDTKELKLQLIDFGQSSNKSNNSKVDALQFFHGISNEFLGVPENIVNVFRTKMLEALRIIYGPNFKLPTSNYRYTFTQEHMQYSGSKGAQGYKEREAPAPESNFPDWFKV